MPSERLIYVDENNNELSVNKVRDNNDIKWKRASGGFVIDPISLKLLCHKGTVLKEKRPGKWVCTFGGKANQGELPHETAVRELFEEYKMRTIKNDLSYLGLIRSDDRKQFESIYLVLSKESEINYLKIDNEVEEIKWIKIESVISNLYQKRNWYNYGHENYFLHKILHTLKKSSYFQTTDKSQFKKVNDLQESQGLVIRHGTLIEDNIIIL